MIKYVCVHTHRYGTSVFVLNDPTDSLAAPTEEEAAQVINDVEGPDHVELERDDESLLIINMADLEEAGTYTLKR